MNIDDDFEGSTWNRRPNDDSDFDMYGHTDERSDSPEIIAVVDPIDLDDESEIVRLARQKRIKARDYVESDSFIPTSDRGAGYPRTAYGEFDVYEYDDPVTKPRAVTSKSNMISEVAIDPDDAWEADLMARVCKNMSSRATDDVGKDVIMGRKLPSGFQPSTQVPPFSVALSAFMRKVENKRVELAMKSAAQQKLEEERGKLTEQLTKVIERIRSAQQEVDKLESAL